MALAPGVLLRWLRAAGEPSRLRLLALCADGALSVSDLARALKQMFGLTTPAASTAAADGAATEEDQGPGNMAKRLRDSGYLTRDGRMKERKKYGRKGARKSFQFSKR